MTLYHGSLVIVESPRILPRKDGKTSDFGAALFCRERCSMKEVTQENLRTILPGKIARAVMMLAESRHCSPKEALLQFYGSRVYKELEIEQTKRWWQSSSELFEDLQQPLGA